MNIDVRIKDLIETISKWSLMCKDRSKQHSKRAFNCRLYDYVLTAIGICCSGTATILSALTLKDNKAGDLAYLYSTVFSGIGTIMYAILNIIDPAGLRISHLYASREYDILGREIDAWIQTEREQDKFDEWRIDAVRIQTRIDSIQSAAPAL